MKITAAMTAEKGSPFELHELELADPKPNEVLIRIVASGVCHTDAASRDGEIPVQYPVVLGHEGSGIVEKAGSNVTSVVPGDHVVISFASCGNCEYCLSGKPAYCSSFLMLNFGGVMADGTTPLHHHEHGVKNFFGQSSFATYAIANERSVVKVDKEIDLALLGPLGCGIQTGAGTVFNSLQPKFGESIAIFGAGSVGLSAVMAAKIIGCSRIIAVDIIPSRLELAKELGATHVINGNEADAVAEIRRITNGGANYSIDTTGVTEIGIQTAEAIRVKGTAAFVVKVPAGASSHRYFRQVFCYALGRGFHSTIIYPPTH
ncbi:NAD(P)-dependent alcohol dehydrogenase [Paenibacillus sepulcri]|uniref:NAD(P)-dependent alcohol dehydrogenase n=1 Tax=Paenibacillus sepulcri TaxID=359917 RepID=UPI0035EE0E1E